MGKNFRETLNKQMDDPKFRAEWDALESERKTIHSENTDYEQASFVEAVETAVEKSLANGHPIARYDANQKKPYMEYPDGSRIYPN